MRQWVLVTGSSSGIGRATALRLARAGFNVFAGVRRPADGEALEQAGGGRIRALILDVLDPKTITSAARQLDEAVGEHGLFALVNNAGVGVSCPLEFQPIEELQKVFQVNVFGVVAVTQAMLPMIRRAQGRVVNIGSIGDRFTVPFGGALCSSKAAVRSLTEALRLELHPFGIHVALVQPTSIATPAVTKFKDEAEARLRTLPPVASELYGDLYRGFIQRAVEEESKGSPPEVVAEAVYEALSEQRPRTRYPVGKGRTLMSILPAVVPDRAFDFIKLLLFGMPVAFGALAMRKVVQARQAAEPRGEETVS